jgi:oxygen-dependent protoporphyrinogen oxidase
MIVIVGGGISGLVLAHRLAASGREFVLLESSSRVGGVMHSGVIDGRVVDWGPQRGRLTGEFRSLVAELDLNDQLITAPADLPLFVYANRTLHPVPFSLRGILRSDLLSRRARARMLLEPATAAARDDETVAAFLTRKLGREVYDNLAGPLYGGLYASDPADMVMRLSLSHALRELNVRRSLLAAVMRRTGMASPAACSFRDGMAVLPRALHARHAEHIRLDTPVRSIERKGSAYVVNTDYEAIPTEHVVITTPAQAAAAILENIAPEAASSIGMLHYNSLAVVHMLAETSLRGLGYQVSLTEPLVTRGVTWNDSLFGREGLYTAFLGGARNPWIAHESMDRVADLAVSEFRTVTQCDAVSLSVEHARIPAWDRSWFATEGLQLPRNVHIHASWHARPGIPGRLSMARRLADRLAADR